MSTRPSLRQLEYFLAAVEHQSFAAAAAHLHIAQPSLSDQIRRLERLVGGQLFVRTNRHLQLTDMGRQLIPLAEDTLRSVDVLSQRLTGLRSLDAGSVSFGTFSSAHLYLLVPVTKEFHAHYPLISMRIVGLNSSHVADMVRNGDIEAGLVQLPIDAQGLIVSDPVLTDTVVYASSDPRNTSEPVNIQQLAERRLILSEARFGESDPLRATLAAKAREAGVKLRPFVEVEFQTAALEMAATGLGDTLVSYLVSRLPQYAGLVSWASLDPVYEERFAIVTRAGGSQSPATQAFITTVLRHLRTLQRRADTYRHPR